MKRLWTIVFVGLFLAILLGATAAGAKTTKTVRVDCAKGESINAVLGEKSDELIVEILGVCREDVAIRRDAVTLRGRDPNLDGIEAVEGVLGRFAVQVRDAYTVRLENLSVTHAEVGLRTDNSKDITVVNCQLQGNERRGAEIFGDSEIAMEATVISGNRIGLHVSGSDVTCTGCSIEDNGTYQVFVDKSGRIDLESSRVAGERGVLGYPASLTFGIGSVVSTTSWALVSVESDITWQEGEIDGSMLAGYGGVIDLYGATQTSQSQFANYIYEGGLLVARGRNGVPTVLIGQTYFDNLSKGVFYGGSNGGVELGDLICDFGGEAVCRGPVALASSNCGLCPLCTDGDGDGFFVEDGCGTPLDCDDSDPEVNPGAEEVCEDGLDNDCDGSDAVCPPPCVATTSAAYVVSGGPDLDAGIFVDDILRVFVEGTLIAEISQGGGCCPPADPVTFAADTGDALRLQAQDANDCYSLGPLYLQKTDGSCLTRLTDGLNGPNCGSEPPEQVFFDETFILP